MAVVKRWIERAIHTEVTLAGNDPRKFTGSSSGRLGSTLNCILGCGGQRFECFHAKPHVLFETAAAEIDTG